ncbi:hypothetical protein [Bradyrhizobium sp. CCBAU 51627]|uniref:hypothetical protein n=1 Tax=Bradyrhizobium sp. CCBAU 51627 TaxID=1325088 RepID=UPI0023055BD5|nr:hypothetical protein [Bradyrhizobium sp. CCBAU 51627]
MILRAAGRGLDRHRHAGAEPDELDLNFQIRAAFRLAAALPVPDVRSPAPPSIARDSVRRHVDHVPMEKPVAREVEGILIYAFCPG